MQCGGQGLVGRGGWDGGAYGATGIVLAIACVGRTQCRTA